MALGSNVEYKASALFQATLDEKSAKQLEGRFVKLSKEAADMSKQEFARAFAELGKEINKSLAQLQIPPIDIKNILKSNSNTDAFKALGVEFGKSFNEGIATTLMQSGQIDKLLKMKQGELQQTQQYKFSRRSTAMRYATRAYDVKEDPMKIINEALPDFIGKDFSGMTEGNIYDYFDNLTTDIRNASKLLQDMPKTTPQDQKMVTQQVETITDLYVRLFEGIRGLQQSSYSVDIAKGAFKSAREIANISLINKNPIITSSMKSGYIGGTPIDIAQAELLTSEILNLTTQSQFAAKSVEDINTALNSLTKAKQGKQLKDVSNTLADYDAGKKANVEVAYENFMQTTTSDFITRFQAALKFLRAYDNPIGAEAKEDWDIQSLYNNLNTMREQIVNTLKLFTSVANEKLNPSVGGSGSGTGGGTGTGSGTGDGNVGSGLGGGGDFISEAEVRQAEEAYDRLIAKIDVLQKEASEANAELERLQQAAVLYGFGSDKTPIQLGKIKDTLSKPVNPKMSKDYTREQYVVDMLKKGYQPTVTQHGEYGFNRPDLGKGVFNPITKTEYEYAEYLSQKIKELNVGWDEGLKILQSQNGQLDIAKNKADALNAELQQAMQEEWNANQAMLEARHLWKIKQNGGTKEDAQRDKLLSKFEIPDDYDYYNVEALENIISNNKEILSQLEKENLLTEKMRTKYEAINMAIEQGLINKRAYYDAIEVAENSFDNLENLYQKAYDTDNPDEANNILEERKRILSEISPLVRDDYETNIKEEMEINSLIEKRIELLRQAQAGRIDLDDIDDIMQENGDLNSKLSRLQDIAYDWGSNIKDSEVDEDEDAIESLQRFEEIYDRIILKLSNGKKVEILPNAKGLRALDKYADGIDSSVYGETEIDDVEFIRKEIQAQEQVNAAKANEPKSVDDSAQIKNENTELSEQVRLYNELIQKAAQYNDLQKFQKENIKSLMAAGIKSSQGTEALWKQARYLNFNPSEMDLESAVGVLSSKVPSNILDGWFRNADSEYKGKLEKLALSDDEIRNAALNVMWSNFKEFSGKDIGFKEFVNSEIPVYRGKNAEKYVNGDEILSFTFDENIAKKFGQNVLETMMRPLDTIGSYQTTAESEVFLRKDQLDQRPEYLQWHEKMTSAINAETQAQEKLNDAETKNPDSSNSIKKEAIAYDEFRKKIEKYLNIRQQITALMDEGKPVTGLMPDFRASKKDITSLFPETGDESSYTSGQVDKMLQETMIGEEQIQELARALGIEIPQAAQQAKGAIDEVAGAQEHLNNVENQNPPTQDDSGVHNANADAIKKEAQSQEELAKKIKETEYLITNQKDWLRTLDPYLNDDNYKTSGKRDATEQLKDTVNRMMNYRRNPNEYVYEQMAEEKRIVDWYKAYQEAQRQGVADSVLQRNNIGVTQFEYENALVALQKERDFRAQLLQEEQEKLKILQQQLDIQNQINAVNTRETPQVDNTSKIQDENVKLDEQNDKLKANINLKGQANRQGVVTPTSAEGTITTPTQTTSEGATSTEVTELEAVRAKVLEVTNAVNAKNKAFSDEGKIVGQVVGKENAALISLKGNIEAITSAVNSKNKAFNDEGKLVGQVVGKENAALMSLKGNINNVNTSLGGALSNIKGVRMPNMSNATSQANIANESQALVNLKARIDEVTAAVRTKTASFVQEEKTVRQSVGNEIASIIQLMQNINNVNTGIQTLTQGLNTTLNNVGALNGININANSTVDLSVIETTLSNILTAIPNAGTSVQNNNAGGGQGGTSRGSQGGDLAGRIAVQSSMLDNFEAKLMDIGQLTPSVQNQIDQLRASLNNVADAPGLTAWINQFKTMRTDMNTEGIIADLNSLGKMATSLGELRAKSAQASTVEERASWDALIQQMETAMQYMQQGINVDQSWLDNKAIDAYTMSMEKYNEQLIKTKSVENQRSQKKTWNDAIKADQQEAGLTKSRTVAQNAYETLIAAGQMQGVGPEQQANLDIYQGKIESLKSTIASFPTNGLASDEQKQRLIEQRLEVDAYTKEIQELIANYQMLSGPNVESLHATSALGLGASAEAYQAELTAAVQSFHHGRASIKAYDAETKTLTYTLKTGKGEFTTYTASIRQTDNALMSVRGATTRTMGVFESIGKKIKEYSYYFTGSMMIYRVIAWVREGITAVKDIDSALTELKKVTDETEESYDRFLDTAAKTASKVGSTIKDVVSSTADWARLGYSLKEAHQMAESTQILMNVSEFTDISAATDSLISSVQAFKYTAEESMDVVDILNTIGNNYAISTADLAKSLTKSSGSLVAANGTLEEAVALTATANTIIQDADVVGTALKTVAMRIRGTSVEEMEEEGLETDGVVESESKLRGKIKSLSGVDILTDAGAYKSTYQILSEIADVWEDINDMDQAALLEVLAGKRAGSVMSAILQNPETLKDAFESANDATGSALEENEKYLDSIQGRMDLFNNSLQTMWNNELNSDIIKWFVELGRVLIETIDLLGLVPSAFIVISLAIMKMNKMNLVEYFGSISNSILSFGTKIKGFVQSVVSSMTATATATDIATVSSFKNAMAVAGLKNEEREAILTKMGLINATNEQILSQNQLSYSTLMAMVNEGKLSQSQATTIMSLLGITQATNEVNAARLNEMLISQGLDKTQRGQIITALGLKGATQALTREEVLQALATTSLNETQKAAILSMLGLDATTKGLAASFGALWTAMWPMLAVMAGIAAIYGVVKLFDALITTTEELKEELSELGSELADIQSDLQSVNDELETTKDRMAELLAMDSLSFTEKEELEQLKKKNAELERQLKLLESLEKSKQTELVSTAKETIDAAWHSTNFDKTYQINDTGVIKEDSWLIAGTNTTDALDKAMKKYQEFRGIRDRYQAVAEQWDDNDDEYNKELLQKYNLSPYIKYNQVVSSVKSYQSYMDNIAEGVDMVLADQYDMIKEGNLSYELNDPEVTAYLNEVYGYADKWGMAKGTTTKADVITDMFAADATEEMQKLETRIQEVSNNEALSLEQQNQQIQSIINSIDKENAAYGRLKTAMETVGLTAKDIADYYTLEKGAFDNSIDGIIAQYQKGIDVLNTFNSVNKLTKLGHGGSVDLLNRPQIDTSELVQAGWDDAGDGIATVYTSTYGNENGTVAVNFTPILPDGSVLSPDELTEYAEGVISGTREDDFKLQIGAEFTGEDAISKAEKAAEEIHRLQELYYDDTGVGNNVIEYLNENGETEVIAWEDLYELNEQTGEATVNIENISKVMKNTSEETREQFSKLVEDVAEGTIDIEQATEKFELYSIQAVVENMKTQLESLNADIFKDLDDEISGIIDTFDEFSSALESVASSMDLVHTAQQQMNSSGQISVKTALELIASTDQWNQILTIENGQIKLVDNAEQILIETKLELIRANIETALQEVNASIALLEGAETATTAGNTFKEGFTNALIECQGILVGLKAAWDAFWAGEDITTAFNNARKSTLNNLTTDEAKITDLYKRREELLAQKEMLEGIDTSEEFKDNYDFDKTPGDKYDDSGSDDAFQKAMDYWENRIAANQARYDQIQNEIDLIESQGGIAGEEYYQEQIKLENERLKLLEAQKAEAQRFLGTFKEGSEEWWEVASTLNDIEGDIDDVTASIQDLGDAIADIDWQVFDETHERFGTLIDDLETVRDLMAPNGEEDWFDDEGKWTEDGVAVLGSYVQQLAMYEDALDRINDKLDKEYSRPYEGNEEYYKGLGIDSEQEYYDAVTKLQDQQQEYLKGVSDTEQAVVDMYEAQIDAIEEYTSELVEHYTEYIDLVKEALDAERELYEFKKDVEKQTKDISALERRIASLSGSDNAADIAERRKLEAQLIEAKEGLNDTYYDHAMDAQQNALDEEGQAYEESMNKYIEKLRETLEEATLNMDLFMETVTASVMLNADIVAGKYDATGVAMSGYLTKPWLDAAQAVKDFEGNSLELMNTWTTEEGFFGRFKANATNQLTSPWSAGTNAAKTFKSDVATQMGEVVKNVESNVAKAKSSLSSLYSQIQDTSKQVSNVGNSINNINNYTGGNNQVQAPSGENVEALQEVLNAVFNAKLTVDGKYGTATKEAVKTAQKAMKSAGLYSSTIDGLYGPKTASGLSQYIQAELDKYKAGPLSQYALAHIDSYSQALKKVPPAMHAKGTLGTKRDEWAITDESWIGEEITLAAGKHGQLQYLKKGSAVMPADISANLVEWGKLDPSSVTMPGVGSVLNMISNSVMQPNYEFNFDSLVHVDHCDEGTLKNLEKMVDTKLNDFGRQLNYSIKKFAR